MNPSRNILVVGAGFTGAVIARELAEAGHSVHVMDKRRHVAGNAHDYVNEHGIRVHQYGPHLFHTKMKDVYDYLSRFTEWLPYQHRVKAQLADGRLVTLPVNHETSQIVGKENVLDVFFRPYTLKMWGIPLDRLDPSVIARVPIRDDDNELYFPNDPYQGIPKDGYTTLISNILDHANIKVFLGGTFTKHLEKDYDHIFSAQPIDEYYDFIYGELPYRSIRFHQAHVPLSQVFQHATVNFTHSGPYTRVTEWKNIPGHGENPYITSLTYEEPCDYRDNGMERYYPVKDIEGKNREIYLRYKNIPNAKVTFCGRTGLYAYLDMDQAVTVARSMARQFIEKQS